MSWLKKIFSSQSSQEIKVYYEVEKYKKEEEKQQVTESDIENLQTDNSQSSWWSSWSGLSQKIFQLPQRRKKKLGRIKL